MTPDQFAQGAQAGANVLNALLDEPRREVNYTALPPQDAPNPGPAPGPFGSLFGTKPQPVADDEPRIRTAEEVKLMATLKAKKWAVGIELGTQVVRLLSKKLLVKPGDEELVEQVDEMIASGQEVPVKLKARYNAANRRVEAYLRIVTKETTKVEGNELLYEAIHMQLKARNKRGELDMMTPAEVVAGILAQSLGDVATEALPILVESVSEKL